MDSNASTKSPFWTRQWARFGAPAWKSRRSGGHNSGYIENWASRHVRIDSPGRVRTISINRTPTRKNLKNTSKNRSKHGPLKSDVFQHEKSLFRGPKCPKSPFWTPKRPKTARTAVSPTLKWPYLGPDESSTQKRVRQTFWRHNASIWQNCSR